MNGIPLKKEKLPITYRTFDKSKKVKLLMHLFKCFSDGRYDKYDGKYHTIRMRGRVLIAKLPTAYPDSKNKKYKYMNIDVWADGQIYFNTYNKVATRKMEYFRTWR